MTFVDEVRTSFDAYEFSRTLRASVGHGRNSTQQALRNTAAVNEATAAVENFCALATDAADADKPGPDVIAPFLAYSPSAAELFAALRAVSVAPALAAAALEALLAIARYARAAEAAEEEDNDDEGSGHPNTGAARPVSEAVYAARAVVKDIVKTHAPRLNDIFVSRHGRCSKKALILLRMVAHAHPWLAKELVNRFDLAASHMAPALCSVSNHRCRVPFLQLLATIFAEADHDLTKYLASDGRALLVAAFSVIQRRQFIELEYGRCSDPPDKPSNPPADPTKSSNPAVANFKLFPSYIQKRELDTAIAFLDAFEKRFLSTANERLRRLACASPISALLARIASYDMPALHVAPNQVTEHHRRLRAKARDIFATIAADPRLIRTGPVVKILNKAEIWLGRPVVVDFVAHVIRAQPAICKPLLDSGFLLSSEPRLSTRWLAVMSLVSSCIARLPAPTTAFRQRRFFVTCLAHDDALVRHYGMLLLLAFCRVLERDAAAIREPLTYVPPLKDVQRAVSRAGRKEEVAKKLLATYQGIFSVGAHNANSVVFTSLRNAQTDLLAAEESVRTALRTAPRESIHSMVQLGCFSSLTTQASLATEDWQSLGMWNLCATVLRQTGLFPGETEREVDVLLCALSSQGEELHACAQGLDDILKQAWGNSHSLFDDLFKEEGGGTKTYFSSSLFSAAIVRRLRKFEELSAKGNNARQALQGMLKDALLLMVACEEVRLASRAEGSFLQKSLSQFLDTDSEWWNVDEEGDAGLKEQHGAACDVVEGMLRKSTFADTPYLRLISMRCSFLRALRDSGKVSPSPAILTPSLSVSPALVWDAAGTYSDHVSRVSQNGPAGNISARYLAANSVLGLMLESRGIPPCASTRDQLEKCQKAFSTEEMTVLLGSLLSSPLPVEEDWPVLRKAIELLLTADFRSGNTEELFSFLQDSVCTAVQRSKSLDKEVVETLFKVIFNTLGSETAFAAGDAKFSFVLLDALTSHSDHVLTTIAQLRLASNNPPDNMTLDTIPPETTQLVRKLLPLFPNLAQRLFKSVISRNHLHDGSLSVRLLPIVSDLFSLKGCSTDGEDLRAASRAVLLAPHSLTDPIQANANAIACCASTSLVQLRHLDKLANLQEVDFQRIRATLASLYDPNNRGEFPLFAWMYLLDSNRMDSPQERIPLPTSSIYDVTRQLAEVIVASPLNAEDHLQHMGVDFLIDTLTDIKQNRSVVFKKSDMTPAFKRNLAILCRAVRKKTATLVKRCKSGTPGKSLDKGLSVCQARFLTSLLLCLSLFLDLDVMESAFADGLLQMCNADEWSFVRYTRKQEKAVEWKTQTLPARDGCLAAVSQLVQAAAKRLSAPYKTDTASALCNIARVLSSSVGDYSLSLSSQDVYVRDAIFIIRRMLLAEEVGQETDYPVLSLDGVFRSKPAVVLLAFERLMLENAQELLFTPERLVNGGNAFASLSESEGERPVNRRTDTLFILSVFFDACRHALHSPTTPVLDIGKVTKEGHFALVVMGLSSPDAPIRSLSYACIELFSELVGPPAGVPKGHAAGLYRERKQLAFVLNLLRDSIVEPQAQLPPLFCAWFCAITQVLLNPGHPANKIVSTFLLRAPKQDISDGLGVFHLLNVEGSEVELIASRHLALDVLRRGLRSARDVQVVRRRRILDSVLLLAGLGGPSHAALRGRALSTLHTVIARGDALGLAGDLTRAHGIVAWLGCDTLAISPITEQDVLTRVRLLASTAKCAHLREDAAASTAALAAALGLLQRRAFEEGMFVGTQKQSVRAAVLQAAAAIARLQPGRRCSIDLDVRSLFSGLSTSPPTLPFAERTDFVTAVAASRRNGTADEHVMIARMLLEYEAQATRHADCDAAAEAELRCGMTHAYVSDWLMKRPRDGSGIGNRHGQPIVDTGLHALLARVVLTRATVWLLVGALWVIRQSGRVSDELRDVAAQVPASIPSTVCVETQRSFDGVVESGRRIVAQALLELG